MSTPDQATVRRLAFIRYLFNLAAVQAREPAPRNMPALLTIDDAVELFLVLACAHLNATVGKPRPNYADYFDPIDLSLKSRLQPAIALRVRMEELHKFRNNLKHHGQMPTSADLQAFASSATEFFDQNTPVVFGIAFADVSIAQLLTNAQARDALVLAETHRAKKELVEAAQQCSIAFAVVSEAFTNEMHRRYKAPDRFGISRSLDLDSAARDVDEVGARRFALRSTEFLNAVSGHLGELLDIMELGLNYWQYARFRSHAPPASRGFGGAWVFERERAIPTDADLQFCLDFVIQTALRFEDLAGGIQIDLGG